MGGRGQKCRFYFMGARILLMKAIALAGRVDPHPEQDMPQLIRQCAASPPPLWSPTFTKPRLLTSSNPHLPPSSSKPHPISTLLHWREGYLWLFCEGATWLELFWPQRMLWEFFIGLGTQLNTVNKTSLFRLQNFSAQSQKQRILARSANIPLGMGHCTLTLSCHSSTAKNFAELWNLDRCMLGRDCLRALFRKQFPHPLNWLKCGFRDNPKMGF